MHSYKTPFLTIGINHISHSLRLKTQSKLVSINIQVTNTNSPLIHIHPSRDTFLFARLKSYLNINDLPESFSRIVQKETPNSEPALPGARQKSTPGRGYVPP